MFRVFRDFAMATIIFEPNRPQNQSSIPSAILICQTTDHMTSCSIGAILKNLYELPTPKYRTVIDRYIIRQANPVLHVKDILNWDSKPLKEMLHNVCSLPGSADLLQSFGATIDDLKFADLFYSLRNFVAHKRPITDAYIGASLFVGRTTAGWAKNRGVVYEYHDAEQNTRRMTGADNVSIMEDTIDNFKTKIYEAYINEIIDAEHNHRTLHALIIVCAADVANELLMILKDMNLQVWNHAVDRYCEKYITNNSSVVQQKKHIIDCLVAVWKSFPQPTLLLKWKYVNIDPVKFIQDIVVPASSADINDPFFLYMAVFATILLTDMLQQNPERMAIRARLYDIEKRISQNVVIRMTRPRLESSDHWFAESSDYRPDWFAESSDRVPPWFQEPPTSLWIISASDIDRMEPFIIIIFILYSLSFY